MAMKVHKSTVEDAKLLSKKLTFLLLRLIYAPVEGTTDLNKALLKRVGRFLKGEWEGLLEEYTEAAMRLHEGPGGYRTTDSSVTACSCDATYGSGIGGSESELTG